MPRISFRGATAAIAATLAAAAVTAPTTWAASAAEATVEKPAPAFTLRALGTYHTDLFDQAAAEIVEHDPLTQRLFVVNAQSGAVDVLDARNPQQLTKIRTVQLGGLPAADGSVIDADAVVNSVSVRDGLLAVAVEAGDKVQLGWTAFFRTSGSIAFLSAVRVGSLPDMLTFTKDGRRVVVANEAEPADNFTSDPEGSVSIIDVTSGMSGLQQSAVRTARFTAFEGAALPAGVRVVGPDVPVPAGQTPAGRVARNLEPEYVTVDADSATAYVALQEASTIAVLDLDDARFERLLPLPAKTWSTTAGLDASDQDGGVQLRPWPVRGLLMPDAISSYQVGGQTYLVTANEGDAREWGSYADIVRLSKPRYPLCADVFPDAASLKRPENLGRLNVSVEDGRRAGSDCYETINTLGGRSFSIFTTDGQLVFDSGSEFEQRVAAGAGGLPAAAFNANHTSNASFDTRSDDKGPEPEGLTIGILGDRTYAFVGLERVGGVMTFDITDPRAVTFADYLNNRNFSAPVPSRAAGDLGPEGLKFVPASASPTGLPLLITANEVSGTTTAHTFAPVTSFAQVRALLTGYRDAGQIPAATAAGLSDRLARAEAAAATGSETQTIRYLQDFVARALNQIKGDAADIAARDALVSSARSLISYYDAVDED